MKYIDAEKLIAEIERLNKENNELRKNGGSIGQEFLFGIGAGYADVLKIIESLQQAQPEVDLEKARNIIRDSLNGVTRLGSLCDDRIIESSVEQMISDLGLNARKEE